MFFQGRIGPVETPGKMENLMIELVAKKKLTYAGKRVAVGGTFSAKPKHAKLLVAVGRASLSENQPAQPAAKPSRAAATAPEVKPEKKKTKKQLKAERKNAYKTRALNADDGKSA